MEAKWLKTSYAICLRFNPLLGGGGGGIGSFHSELRQ
jgi:hypothetical protein